MDEKKEFENQSQEPEQQMEPYIAESKEESPVSGEQEPVAELSGGPALQADGSGAAAKKPNTGMIALIAVAAVLVIAIVAILVIGGLSKKPEEAVREALSLTKEQMQTMSDQLIAEIPAYRAMMPQEGGRASSFTLNVDSIESPYLGEEAGMINGIAKMFSISGQMISDPGSKLAELSGQVNLAGSPLVDLYLQMSPEQMAFNMPKFSDTLLSINPQTIASDIKNSPLYNPYMDDQSLTAMQDAMASQFDAMASMSGLDAKKLQEEMYAIMDGFLVDAVYEKPQKSNGLNVYTVKLNGGQVQSTLVALAKYIYIDSDIARMWQAEMKTMMQEQIIDPLERELPPLPSTMTLTVGKDGAISQLDFELDVDAIEGNEGDSRLNAFNGSCVFDGTTGQTVTLLIDGSDAGMAYMMDMDVSSTYVDGVSDTAMKMKMDVADESVNMDMKMTFDKAGLCDVTANIDVDTLAKVDMALKGTYTDENGASKWDFPTLSIGATIPDPSGAESARNAINLKLSGESSKLEQPAQPVAGTTPLFSMSEAELSAEMQKYNDGMNAVIQDVFGAVLTSGIMGMSPAA